MAQVERIERKVKHAPHPALVAFAFHRAYVTTHPFHDGNGRTAGIFSNLLLMRFGYPPVVIRVDEKDTYNNCLAEVQVYGAPNRPLRDRYPRSVTKEGHSAPHPELVNLFFGWGNGVVAAGSLRSSGEPVGV